MAQVLREYVDLQYDNNLISEARKTNKPITLSGIFQRSEAVNQNGRIYPHSVLSREIVNYSKLVAEGRAMGELDHPADNVISLKNVSHVVREIGWKGNDVVGKIEVLNTPAGRILQDLMESGIRLGISSRGMGAVTMDENGNSIVNDYMLACFDVVSDPSTHGAWLNESKNVNMQAVLQQLSKRDRVNRVLNDILNP